MGFWNWKYTASDVADWFDAEDEKYWRQHDEWLIQSQAVGDAHPVFVFASWYGDRINTLPQRVNSLLAASIVDVLRLGNDFDFDSALGVAKGVFLNLTRLVAVIDPAAQAVRAPGRYASILATSKLKYIEGALGPCSFVSVNNVLSYIRGRTVQLFGVVDDIVRVAGSNSGINREVLLASAEVQGALARYGVTFARLQGLRSIDDVVRAARSSQGPVVFSIEWKKGTETLRHALTAVKDASGSVRILDYVEAKGFKGFASLAEIAKARPEWGTGFVNATLRITQPVVAFSDRYLKVLKFADDTYQFAVPIAMGVKWLRGTTSSDRAFEIARSAWRFLQSKLDDKVPTPPTASVLPNPPETSEKPPAVPDEKGKRLGVAPVPDVARKAPRIDWLTGVQYRLRFLGYYRGQVHGQNDESTKRAVLSFQKAWFKDRKEWDAIPGPITQGMLYAVVGW